MDRKQEELQSQVNANEMLQYKEDKLGEELADAVRKNS